MLSNSVTAAAPLETVVCIPFAGTPDSRLQRKHGLLRRHAIKQLTPALLQCFRCLPCVFWVAEPQPYEVASED